MRVSELLHQESHDWNLEAIRHHLSQYEAHIRLLVPSSLNMQDELVWLASKTGSYSSKSGYAITKLNSESLDQTFNWKAGIWNIRTSPKLKHLLWKIKNRAIPVGMNLEARGMTGNFECKRCGQPETEVHLFMHCPFAGKVWELAPVAHAPRPDIIATTADLLRTASKLVSLPPTGLHDAALAPWIIWYLWSARNKLAFEDITLSEQEVVTLAIKEARSWQKAQSKSTPSAKPPPSKLPSPPPLLNQPQCYVDAAWISATNKGGFGWIFKDPVSGAVRSLSSNRSHVSSALVAEALAVKAALQDAVSLGLTSVTFWSDSKSLVSALSSQDKLVEIQGVLHDIHVMSESLTSNSFNHIPRSKNLEADALAKSALYEA